MNLKLLTIDMIVSYSCSIRIRHTNNIILSPDVESGHRGITVRKHCMKVSHTVWKL